MLFIFHFVNTVYYIDWFADTELFHIYGIISISSWKKINDNFHVSTYSGPEYWTFIFQSAYDGMKYSGLPQNKSGS